MLEIDWAREFLGQMSSVFMKEYGEQLIYKPGLYESTRGLKRIIPEINSQDSEFADWVKARISSYEGVSKYSVGQNKSLSSSPRVVSSGPTYSPTGLKQRQISNSSPYSNQSMGTSPGSASQAASTVLRRAVNGSSSPKSASSPSPAQRYAYQYKDHIVCNQSLTIAVVQRENKEENGQQEE